MIFDKLADSVYPLASRSGAELAHRLAYAVAREAGLEHTARAKPSSAGVTMILSGVLYVAIGVGLVRRGRHN